MNYVNFKENSLYVYKYDFLTNKCLIKLTLEESYLRL